MNDQINSLLEQIKEQYCFQSDKDLITLLQGLASKESKGVTYWDYIETDTLLSLQKPKTDYPDEVIFITYHQLCELYFKLIIQELERLNDFYQRELDDKTHKIAYTKVVRDDAGKITGTALLNEIETWHECLERITRYWQNLITSFDVLKSGFSTAEFMEFRKALLPASGFQTYQFRKMEIMLTPIINLTIPASENKNEIYWRSGAMNGKNDPSKLLQNFNHKYDNIFFELIDVFKGKTIYERFEGLNAELKQLIKPRLEKIESCILLWKIAHMHMIYQHIPSTESATGGIDYLNYLPQLREVKNDEGKKETVFNRSRQIVYFPEFWKDRDANSYIETLIEEFPKQISETIERLYSGNNKTQTKKM